MDAILKAINESPFGPIIHEVFLPRLGPLSYFHAILFAIYIVPNAYKLLMGGGGDDQVKARHILVKTEKECVAIAATIAEDPTHLATGFAAQAKEHSTCPSGKSGGDLGKFGKGQMVKEFETVCFAPERKVGKVYGPLKSQFGWHLILITEIFGAKEKQE